jgi:outer membrane protein assembly factor BamB
MAPQTPLRVWPGIVLVVLQWLAWMGIPLIAPETLPLSVLGTLAAAAAILVWWLFFSRAPWPDRLGAVALMGLALALTPRLLHESVATAGLGMLFFFWAIPILSLTLVVAAAATRRLSNSPRRAAMAAAILLGSGGWALVRTAGVTGDFRSEFAWRWAETPEERLLARPDDEPLVAAQAGPAIAAAAEPAAEPAAEAAEPSPAEELPAPAFAPPVERRLADSDTAPPTLPAPVAVRAAEWPGFRGPQRDGVVRGVRLATDWSVSPPAELWRRPIGPGWSSFAVRGDLLYTQEQRGEEEVVSAYRVSTGEPVWRHRDGVRFWESNGGAGPRATPTVGHDRVYTLGATGTLNALDAETGAVVWSRNAAADTGADVPTWGFASSPLLIEDLVIVHAGALAAYDVATGDSRWLGPARSSGYSSPHLAIIDGIAQVLMLSGARASGVAPADGALLWEHAWSGGTIVQPAVMADGGILFSTTGDAAGNGIRRLAVARGPAGWAAEERWTSIGLKPYFNDYVVHDGHAYGFDGRILSCIDLTDGSRKWKGGRYGHGQLVVLPEQDLLLVLSEDGELALVRAAPDRFTEVARFPVLEGKTWNHPVIVGDVLLARNGQEIAAFRLPVADR